MNSQKDSLFHMSSGGIEVENHSEEIKFHNPKKKMIGYWPPYLWMRYTVGRTDVCSVLSEFRLFSVSDFYFLLVLLLNFIRFSSIFA